MEKAELLGKITKISQNLDILDRLKINDNVRKELVKKERGKKRSLDKYYTDVVSKKKKLEECLMSQDQIDKNAFAWRQFVVSKIFIKIVKKIMKS